MIAAHDRKFYDGAHRKEAPIRTPILLDAAISEFHPAMPESIDVNAMRTDLMMRLICMRSAGDTACDYETLAVVSGHAFAFAYHPKKFWLMYETPDSPWDTDKRIVDATGFAWEGIKAGSADEAWSVIKQQIDAGRPLAAHWFDHFLIAGYEDSAEKTGRKAYVLGKWGPPGWMTWQELEEWTQRFGRLCWCAGKATKTDEREMARALLKKAVEWGRGDGRANVDFMKDGNFGPAGMEAFAADVADVSKPIDYFDRAWCACHAVNRQALGRKCAAVWLGRIAAEFEKSADALRAAAREYMAAYEEWCMFRKRMSPPPDAQKGAMEKLWADPALRAAAAADIRRAAACEAAAVDDVAGALGKLL